MNSERLIGPNTVGLLYLPPDYEVPRKGIFAIWRRHVVANAQVRKRDYMKDLFARHFPGCQILEVQPKQLPDDVLGRVENIVLLYADPNGMDCGWIERAIANRWPEKRVLVLNGRNRFFRLDSRMHKRLSLRRFLETFRIAEIALALAFIAVTPFLLFFDILRGRR